MTDLTFTFNGVSSSTYGLKLTERPYFTQAQEDIDHIEVPGRAGTLTIRKGGYMDRNATLSAYVPDETNMRAVMAWLRGPGTLILGCDPLHQYDVVFPGGIEPGQLIRGFGPRTLDIPIRVKPFAERTGVSDIVRTSSGGQVITNEGNVASEPLLIVSCTGDGEIHFQDYDTDKYFGRIEFEGFTNGFRIDTKRRDIYNYDGTGFELEGTVSADFPVLPRKFWVFFTNVTSLRIKPRWRDDL